MEIVRTDLDSLGQKERNNTFKQISQRRKGGSFYVYDITFLMSFLIFIKINASVALQSLTVECIFFIPHDYP